ncbi:hypothetical protein [Duganella sp. Root336D2]|uniref:hypothetical protein n=1 Tax=Duganella sp. Root336D2 TaxID=1736518 RepID=UPI0006F237B0|nr:hypothetical protein [Duganella sp. Root336D2]KQV51365.1 hypothetical protein ASD07_10750 [Duganella sp. Root336D2]
MRFDLHPFSGIDAAREWARSEIDGAAAVARGRFLTLSPGQESIYQAKYEEAFEFASNGFVGDEGAYPWLVAEALHTGVPLREVAERIKEKGDHWRQIYGPRIEALRVAAKAQVARLDEIGQVVTAARIAVLALQKVKEEGA